MAAQLSITHDGCESFARSPSCITVAWIPSQYPKEKVYVFRDGREIASVSSLDGRFYDDELLPQHTYHYEVRSEPGISTEEMVESTFALISAEMDCDVLVYDASASGVAAAVAAARLGRSTLLLNPTLRIGGMAANGLGLTDLRSLAHSNGFFEEFRQRVKRYYGAGDGLRYEPRVANAVMKEMLREQPRLLVMGDAHFIRLEKRDGTVGSVMFRVGGEETPGNSSPESREIEIHPKMVIDATIEGDLASAAGARYQLGRERRSAEDPHNGQIFFNNSTGEMLPGSTGKPDRKIQAYAFLLTAKRYEDRAPLIPAPNDYNPEFWRNAPPWEESWACTAAQLPKAKFEINQHPWGSDGWIWNDAWPRAREKERREIADTFRDRALGYLHYIQTEQGHTEIGLSDDDYPDNNGFPPVLYVREGRRILGRTYVTERQVTDARRLVRPDAIAIADYPMDSHAVRPPQPGDLHRGDGEMYLKTFTPWSQVPIGALLPQGLKNVIVSSAVSASHPAYGTLRLEPVRMSMGEAAGITAALALQYNRSPEAIHSFLIQEKLIKENAWCTWYQGQPVEGLLLEAVQILGTRGYFAEDRLNLDDVLTVERAAVLLAQLWASEGGSLSQAHYVRAWPEEISYTAALQYLYALGIEQPASLSPTASVSSAQWREWLLAVKSRLDTMWLPLTPDEPLSERWIRLRQLPLMGASVSVAEAVKSVYLAHRGYLLGRALAGVIEKSRWMKSIPLKKPGPP